LPCRWGAGGGAPIGPLTRCLTRSLWATALERRLGCPSAGCTIGEGVSCCPLLGGCHPWTRARSRQPQELEGRGSAACGRRTGLATGTDATGTYHLGLAGPCVAHVCDVRWPGEGYPSPPPAPTQQQPSSHQRWPHGSQPMQRCPSCATVHAATGGSRCSAASHPG
jgi:hypothetical protein